MACALLMASLDPSSLVFRRLQLQKSTKTPPRCPEILTHISLFPEHVACFFPQTAYQQMFDISELNKFPSLSVFSLTGTAVYVHNI